uniref:Uncharacterized protein n=1 Tax=Caenorhabditis japonica TaxID=281687 RepID=A0A8R1IB77_CAEJA
MLKVLQDPAGTQPYNRISEATRQLLPKRRFMDRSDSNFKSLSKKCPKQEAVEKRHQEYAKSRLLHAEDSQEYKTLVLCLKSMTGQKKSLFGSRWSRRYNSKTTGPSVSSPSSSRPTCILVMTPKLSLLATLPSMVDVSIISGTLKLIRKRALSSSTHKFTLL